jgi:hypothetical protein
MGWNVSWAYLTYRVCRTLFRMSPSVDVRCATYRYRVRLATDHVEGFVLFASSERGLVSLTCSSVINTL